MWPSWPIQLQYNFFCLRNRVQILMVVLCPLTYILIRLLDSKKQDHNLFFCHWKGNQIMFCHGWLKGITTRKPVGPKKKPNPNSWEKHKLKHLHKDNTSRNASNKDSALQRYRSSSFPRKQKIKPTWTRSCNIRVMTTVPCHTERNFQSCQIPRERHLQQFATHQRVYSAQNIMTEMINRGTIQRTTENRSSFVMRELH